jgi:hypothetical protein
LLSIVIGSKISTPSMGRIGVWSPSFEKAVSDVGATKMPPTL